MMSGLIRGANQNQNQNQNQGDSIPIGLPLAGLALPHASIPRRPIGVSPSLDRSKLGHTFVGQKWPPALESSQWPDAPLPRLPDAGEADGGKDARIRSLLPG